MPESTGALGSPDVVLYSFLSRRDVHIDVYRQARPLLMSSSVSSPQLSCLSRGYDV